VQIGRPYRSREAESMDKKENYRRIRLAAEVVKVKIIAAIHIRCFNPGIMKGTMDEK